MSNAGPGAAAAGLLPQLPLLLPLGVACQAPPPGRQPTPPSALLPLPAATAAWTSRSSTPPLTCTSTTRWVLDGRVLGAGGCWVLAERTAGWIPALAAAPCSPARPRPSHTHCLALPTRQPACPAVHEDRRRRVRGAARAPARRHGAADGAGRRLARQAGRAKGAGAGGARAARGGGQGGAGDAGLAPAAFGAAAMRRFRLLIPRPPRVGHPPADPPTHPPTHLCHPSNPAQPSAAVRIAVGEGDEDPFEGMEGTPVTAAVTGERPPRPWGGSAGAPPVGCRVAAGPGCREGVDVARRRRHRRARGRLAARAAACCAPRALPGPSRSPPAPLSRPPPSRPCQAPPGRSR